MNSPEAITKSAEKSPHLKHEEWSKVFKSKLQEQGYWKPMWDKQEALIEAIRILENGS